MSYSNIDWGDSTYSGAIVGTWVNPTHAQFSAVHTYTTVGTFPITNTVVYTTDPMFTWIDRNAMAVCQFNSVTTTNRTKGPICGNGTVET